MSTVSTLPVPIEFSLPDGWRSVPPKEVNAEGAAFVAVHPASSKGFTANITITGDVRSADEPLTRAADQALDDLRAGASDVELGKRNEVGTDDNPGLTQAVRLSIPYEGKQLYLVQLQAFIGMADTGDPSRRAVTQVVLSALPEQFDQLVGDFQDFLSTVRPEGA
ncbi:hypothetical protein JHE00_20985 [Prauserella sp. ASG 168]|uniref:DUF1795 domain-containing protein n=2 Tax=Prauserella cavernicola TaxID=2800127 RepID=A0A934V7J7_9PSEU|nr:hypothetical protein [Prauserella cavernicola]